VQEEIAATTGKKPFIPVAAAAGKTGPGGVTRWIYDSVLPMSYNASRKMDTQKADLAQSGMESMIRQGYGTKADSVIDMLRSGGRLDDAVIAGNKKILTAPGTRTKRSGVRDVLTAASQMANTGTPTMKQISLASKRLFQGEGSKGPLRQMADDLTDLFQRTSTGEPGVAQRGMFYKIMQHSAGMTFFPLAAFFTSKPVQRIVLGDTKLQSQLLRAINAGREKEFNQLVGRIARQAGISATGDAEEEIEEAVKPVLDGAKEYIGE